MNAFYGVRPERMTGEPRPSFHLFPFISGYSRIVPPNSTYFQPLFGLKPFAQNMLSKNTLQNDPFSKKVPIRSLETDHEPPPAIQPKNVDKPSFHPRKSAIIGNYRLSVFPSENPPPGSVLGRQSSALDQNVDSGISHFISPKVPVISPFSPNPTSPSHQEVDFLRWDLGFGNCLVIRCWSLVLSPLARLSLQKINFSLCLPARALAKAGVLRGSLVDRPSSKLIKKARPSATTFRAKNVKDGQHYRGGLGKSHVHVSKFCPNSVPIQIWIGHVRRKGRTRNER